MSIKYKRLLWFMCIVALLSFSLPSFVQAQEAVPAEEVVTTIYTDVDLGQDEYVAIKYLTDKGILKGYADGSFRPNVLINRIESLKIILEANNIIDDTYIEENKLGGVNYAVGSEAISFTDIYKSQWYYPYIKKSYEENIVGGYPDNTFKPTLPVHRSESYKMLMESDNLEFPEVLEPPFADVPANEWYAKYIQEAKNREIIYFSTSNMVYPGIEMNRYKFAGLVYRYLMSQQGHKFGKASYYHDSLAGNSTSSGAPYDPSLLTAAHRSLPFGTMLRVTNLNNGSTVDVVINDRGPYITGRVLDLSRAAFETISHPGSGVVTVEYEFLP